MSDGSLKDFNRNRTFCEGWLEHKAQRPTGDRYERLYALLEGNVIYIFTTNKPSPETQVGNLTIENDAVFTVKSGGSPSKGYKFDLHTGKRLNRFKTKKFSERELWRGYVEGITKGAIPKNLDLLDTEIEKMQRDVTFFHTGELCDYDPRKSITSKESRGDSGMVSLGPSRVSGSSSSSDTKSMTSRVTSVSGTLNPGGPTVVHRFYNDHNREQTPPSWFISRCSRELAEKILETANSMNYGNTLMRESTSFLSNGSYVISKVLINKSSGKVEYEHYEVIRMAAGYKIQVKNPHAPMKCLYDVMQYFVSTSGGHTTPLKVNDLKLLGQDTPGYASQIMRRESSGDPWKWPPSQSDKSSGEPMPDYDNTGSAHSPSTLSRHIDGSNTLSPGILRNRTPPGHADRKSVGWSSVIKTPPPLNTFAGIRSPRDPTPSLTEIQQRTREADELKKFNEMIDGFETGFQRDTVYINSPTQKNENPGYNLGHAITNVPVAPRPPPVPHSPLKPHSYVNEVKSPVAETSKLRNATSFPSSKESSSSPVVLRSNSSSASSTSGSVSSSYQRRQQVSKSVSDGQFKNLKSPNSPGSFPMWEKKTQSPTSPNRLSNVPNQTNQSKEVTTSSDKTGESGVDLNNQGGVNTLRNRFENNSNLSQATPQVKQAERRVQFQADRRSTLKTTLPSPVSPPVTDRLTARRQTEPAINVHHDLLAGLNPEFKNKLEDMLKGATVGTAAAKGPRKVPPVPNAQRPTSYNEDHEYQELPEIIPDAVTYVNERFNINDQDNM